MTANNFTPTDEMYCRVCHVMIFIGQHILIKRVVNIDDTDIERTGAVYSVVFQDVCGRRGEVLWVGLTHKEKRRNFQTVCLLMDREMC